MPGANRLALRMHPKQGDVWWVNLDPTVGHEISKKRPFLIVSPDDMNAYLGTVIAAPITSTLRAWPTRVAITFSRKQSSVALDQIRSIDKARLIRRASSVNAEPALDVLREMFAKA